ncbi:MAG: bifunctional phosphopantothenoylcysteine decarboxylase/phosphopantothenate--cysteine ligase CoaBC [Flavobacteriaceae bacterium]|nr:bifunctional phosphopantothenoylcysteine decarboxylase/phosphopantothenate--cysteine ligase CoaBC [Flavobacteriaceae bacterium]
MSLLSGKKVLLGISGGIAAYKTPILVRELIKKGAKVRVVMTPSAKDFVTPLTLSTVSKNPVLSSFIATDQDNPLWNDHVALGLWADLLLVAPATANTISNMAHAVCNNLLLATYLSAKCPVFIAPAMDLDMYAHKAQQKNLSALKKVGNVVFPVGEGALASGLSGQGRMLEPIEIVSLLEDHLLAHAPLRGHRILITAGPTHEAIDPVRFIGNHSSGKMGFALASAALELGAEVILISGPTALEINHIKLNRIDVVTAAQMMEAVIDHYANASIAISAAAVSDYTPKHKASQKIKKENSDARLTLELIKTKDILGYMGENKKNQIVIGFALETENEEVNAKAKMITKNVDAIILNVLHQENEVFNSDKNEITIFHKDGRQVNFKKQSKLSLAHEIFKQIL